MKSYRKIICEDQIIEDLPIIFQLCLFNLWVFYYTRSWNRGDGMVWPHPVLIQRKAGGSHRTPRNVSWWRRRGHWQISQDFPGPSPNAPEATWSFQSVGISLFSTPPQKPGVFIKRFFSTIKKRSLLLNMNLMSKLIN